jgi:hypothetical protein
MKKKTSIATETLVRLQAREDCLRGVTIAETIDLSSDPVEHPAHYQGNGYEVLDIIEDFDLNFNLGNVLKYVLRAGRKGSELKEEDLEKALFYLKRELKVD